jgi:hypothetical protein
MSKGAHSPSHGSSNADQPSKVEDPEALRVSWRELQKRNRAASQQNADQRRQLQESIAMLKALVEAKAKAKAKA